MYSVCYSRQQKGLTHHRLAQTRKTKKGKVFTIASLLQYYYIMYVMLMQVVVTEFHRDLFCLQLRNRGYSLAELFFSCRNSCVLCHAVHHNDVMLYHVTHYYIMLYYYLHVMYIHIYLHSYMYTHSIDTVSEALLLGLNSVKMKVIFHENKSVFSFHN